MRKRRAAASPQTAQFAIRETSGLADNMACAIAQRQTRPFSYQSKAPWPPFGHPERRGWVFSVIRLGGSGMAAMARILSFADANFAKRTSAYPVRRWTWNVLFSADIINLRFTLLRKRIRKDIVPSFMDQARLPSSALLVYLHHAKGVCWWIQSISLKLRFRRKGYYPHRRAATSYSRLDILTAWALHSLLTATSNHPQKLTPMSV
jgi:hypothetical protein